MLVTKTLVVLGDPPGDHARRASARRDAARLRQEHRQGGRRGLDAGAAERIADDVHASTASSTSSSPSAAATTRASIIAFSLPQRNKRQARPAYRAATVEERFAHFSHVSSGV